MKVRPATTVVVLLLIAAFALGCASPQPAAAPAATQAPAAQAPAAQAPAAQAPAASAGQAPEFIEIGASIPLTGRFGSLGTQVKPGYEMAIEDINAAGGVYVKEFDKKIPLRLTAYDDESDPTKAVSKLETVFAERNPVAYMGGAGSDMHVATTAIAEKNKVPYCGVSFALWNVHQKGYKYLFSPFVKSPAQGKDIYEYLNAMIPEGQRPTKVAIWQEKSDWGNELGQILKENAPKYGYEVVAFEEYAGGTKDYSNMVTKAKSAGAEALLSMPTQPDGVAMFKQMAELGWTPKFSLVIRAPENVKWYETLGKTGDFVTIFPSWHNAMKFPGVEELNKKYQAAFGRPADLLTGPAYACIQILANAIEKAGTLDREKIRDAMAATDMTTVVGPVSFNADGTGRVVNPLIQWVNGKLEVVWPKDHASANFVYPAPPFDQR